MEVLKQFSVILFLKLLIATLARQDMSCALEKMIIAEVSKKIQSQISGNCGNITIFQEMFVSPLPK